MSEWIYFLHSPRLDFAATISPEEEKVFGEHFAYLKKLHESQVLILAGPTLGSVNTGVVIFRAPDEDAARRIMNDDPTIREKIVTGELRRFHVSLVEGRNP